MILPLTLLRSPLNPTGVALVYWITDGLIPIALRVLRKITLTELLLSTNILLTTQFPILSVTMSSSLCRKQAPIATLAVKIMFSPSVCMTTTLAINSLAYALQSSLSYTPQASLPQIEWIIFCSSHCDFELVLFARRGNLCGDLERGLSAPHLFGSVTIFRK